MTSAGARPLEGVRVLDLSRVLAGPTAAQTLADLGAEVIKIERPTIGDDTRLMGPHFAKGSGKQTGELVNRSAYYWAVNRGKSSVAIDLAHPEGADLVRGLAAKADVLIENFKVGGLDRYGLGYAGLATINPRLVYCSITGFGQTGPYRTRAGYDSIIQAMGGLMSITGEPDGSPGGGPQRSGAPMIDIMTGLYASTAILAALRHRDTSGAGQHIDLGLLDVMVSSLSYFGVAHLASGRVPTRTGTRNPVTHPSGIYACSDGQVMIIAGNDDQFRRMSDVLGLPGLVDDPRFATSPDRVANAKVLDAIVGPAMAARTMDDCLAAFEKAGIPAGPINSLERVFADPQVRDRGDVVEFDHPGIGAIACLASPMRLSATPVRYDHRPAMLGEHTRQTLRDLLGLPEAVLDALKARGAIE
jgi:crotonobetainyl-CoA:carnitine CoA-transferase CaiB-like acyl-CoA transferase